MQPITLHFTPTKDDYANSIRVFHFQNRKLWVSFAIFLPLFICALFGNLRGNLGLGSIISILILLVVPGLIYYYMVLQPQRLASQIVENEQLQKPVTWEITDDQVMVRRGSASSRFGWDAFQKVIDTKDYTLMVYADKSSFQFIPKRAFDSEEQEKAFHQVMQDKINQPARKHKKQ